MDAITLTAIVAELRQTVVDGRVQAVTPPDAASLALEIYQGGQRRWLLCDASAGFARLHLLPDRARRGLETDTPFLLLCRKYLDGARLAAIHQPPWERVIYFHFTHHAAAGATLVAEIMGRRSNLILLDQHGAILDALRRAGPQQNAYRVILPGQPYAPPPPLDHLGQITQVGLADLQQVLDQAPAAEPLWKALVHNLAGLSPLAARELAFRAAGAALATAASAAPQAVLQALAWFGHLPERGDWQPTVALSPHQDAPLAFAPYELSHLGRLRPYTSISAAAAAFYQAAIGADRYAGRRRQAQAWLDRARHKLERRRASLQGQHVGAEAMQELRSFGEWILAYAHQVQPGAAELQADTGAGVLRIPLDPSRSPAANAQDYFARYRKAKAAAAKIPDLLEAVERDLAYVEQLQTDLNLAEDAPHIEEVRLALLAAGLAGQAQPPRQPVLRSQPLRLQSVDGFTVLIARNAAQGERLTWDVAGPEDLWLHAHGLPGAHVLIVTAGRQPPMSTITQAAGWAAYHSRARADTRVEVIYTWRRHLRRLKGGRPGQVRVLQMRTIAVAPQKPPPQT